MILSICQLANQINQCIYITHLSTPPPPQKTKNLECKTIRREVGWRAQILIWVWNILSRPTLPPVSLKSCINSDIFKVHIFWKFVHHIFLHYWCVFRNLSIKQKLIEKVHICLENSVCMYVVWWIFYCSIFIVKQITEIILLKRFDLSWMNHIQM